uniref:Uncharacterized protein n=1 Tax=Oryza meridionalis TaxID=40149 RepID=A0A0E0DZF9_9ORYZ
MADESYLTNNWIAGVPTVRLGDVCSFVRTLDPTSFALRVDEDEPNSCARAPGLILNTDEFPRVYTIGPLGADRANSLAPLG